MTWPRDRFSPASLRAFANAPLTGEAVEPVETPPSVADSHLDNLQAVCRQLRDDLAAAERKVDLYEQLLACVGGELVPTERGHFAWQVGHECMAFVTAAEAEMLREVIG